MIYRYVRPFLMISHNRIGYYFHLCWKLSFLKMMHWLALFFSQFGKYCRKINIYSSVTIYIFVYIILKSILLFSSTDLKVMRAIVITLHPLMSAIVCKLFKFHSSSRKQLWPLKPNLTQMLIGWYFTKLQFSLLITNLT